MVVFAYACMEILLLVQFVRRKKAIPSKPLTSLPRVTIQLPVYNEKHVVDRLIETTCQIDYPDELLDIQVLDDSEDETSDIIRSKVEEFQSLGIDITHIRRGSREGFKAGALAHGMTLSKGDFIAIFDADFIPSTAFLKQTLPFFSDEKVGVVQSRWKHLNPNYSLLTRIQAFMLNTHFSVEQGGRNQSNAFINFNGTGGIWRKESILDAGGWQADTLTEDLDLSFRAQLKGWRFQFLYELESPSELPITMSAFRSQQFRWAKGAAECAKKNLGELFASKKTGLKTKIIGAFHLLNSSAYLIVLGFILLTLPLAYAYEHNEWLKQSLLSSSFLYITNIMLFVVFFSGNAIIHKQRFLDLIKLPFLFVGFLITTMGISVYMSMGVLQGYLGIKTAFVRTPKYNLITKKHRWALSSYARVKLKPVIFVELLVFLYGLFTMYYSYTVENTHLFVFCILFCLGLLYTILTTLYQSLKTA